MTEPVAKKHKSNKTPTEDGPIVLQAKDGSRCRCLYILQKKNRQCNMTRRKSDKYCAQHKVVSILRIQSWIFFSL